MFNIEIENVCFTRAGRKGISTMKMLEQITAE